MRPLTEAQIRASFVNCSKGEAKRLSLPRDLPERPWDDLDFLGWRDPSGSHRSYLISEQDDRVVGVVLRTVTPSRGRQRRLLCSLCLTSHTGDGVSLMTAGRSDGNSFGLYICTDLDCSLYLRGIKKAGPGGRFDESLQLETQIGRTRDKLADFLAPLL
ncbi:FBP domain-containing protein [Actinocorallia longicatena]|uniref:FBP domain-containing protein n=1 Tax=Actinocorallia longicatena TaxID=111803 RepID=A0ABP6QA05_9ACTN